MRIVARVPLLHSAIALGLGLGAAACQPRASSDAQAAGEASRGSPEVDGEQDGEPGGDDGASGETGSAQTPEDPPTGSPLSPFEPAEPLPPFTALEQARDCPALPKLYDDSTMARRDAYELARALSALACEPRLHTLPAATVAAELRPPKWMKIEFYAGGARIESERLPPATELARMLGIDDPVARLEWQAYHQQWFLDTESSGKLAAYGPGKISVMVSMRGDGDAPAGTKLPLGEDTKLQGVFMVAMPESVVAVGPDPEGLKQVVTAVKRMAADAESLRLPPEEITAKFGLESERWQIARVTRSQGEARTSGISIDPQRTRIPADTFAAALGFERAHALNVNREHAVWKVAAVTSTDLSLGNATLSIRVRPESTSGRKVPLAGATVEFITLLPNTPDE